MPNGRDLGGDVLIGAPRARRGWIEYRKVRARRHLFGRAGAALPGGAKLGHSVFRHAFDPSPVGK